MKGLLDLWTDEFKELLQGNLTKWAEIPETRIIELMAPEKQQMMAKFKRWQSDQMQEKGTGDLKNKTKQNNNNNSGNLAAKLSWHFLELW